MWAITTEGELYPCPVMRRAQPYSVGSIATARPTTMAARYRLLPPCTDCELLGLCGGRYLSANVYKRWGEDGFTLVCDSVRHLVAELERVQPAFVQQIERGRVQLAQLDLGMGYEVIP